jgi:agmatinase
LTFGDIHESFGARATASIYLQSIPYDGTSTWGKGADKGYHSFLEAARNLELYDIETDSEVYKKGIHLLPPLSGFSSPLNMFEQTYKNTNSLLKEERFLTFIGGEHSISIGIIQAFQQAYKNLTVLQIDAHADLRSEYNGSPYNHACALHQASKTCNLIQVGIRSMDISERDHMNMSKCFFSSEVLSSSSWIQESINLMTDDVYITLDLDAFDPSIMPATGTPEPGGLDWTLMTKYLEMVFSNRNVVGFDIVELAPIEHLHFPQFLVAKLYYKMLSYKFYR